MQIKYPSPGLQKRRRVKNAILAMIGTALLVSLINLTGQSDDICPAVEMANGIQQT